VWSHVVLTVVFWQAIADAYYVLSDPKRRREYDLLYNARSDRTDAPSSSGAFFTQFANMFSGGPTNATGEQPENAQPDPNGVFADVFDEVSNLGHLYT
jgi:curved DNA-binding protein CbpA